MWIWISLQILLLLCAASIYSKAEEGELHATVKSLHVISDIKYRYATTRVSAEYVNTHNNPVVADFHVTLPARAYISNFSMDIDGNVTYGVVKKKEEAKAIYDEAVAQGQSTGYIEVKHRFTNVYDISVNIEPGKNIVFNLTYQELLQRSLGKYRHVIHLINKEIINNFVIEVFISEPQDIIDIQIPKNMADEMESPKEGTTELEGAIIEYVDNKNIHIRYNPSVEEQRKFGGDGVEGLFKVYYDVDRKNNPNLVYAIDGYFVHFFAPDSQPKLPKNIVFMLDISGSMNGGKMMQLKLAMVTILNSLKPDVDNFLIGMFSGYVSWMNGGVFMPAEKKNIAAAINEVEKICPSGGTNINNALLESINKLNHVQSRERKSVFFFLTDGSPTVGVVNTDFIQANVKKANNESISIFMLGFGEHANNQFLKEVATENGGFSRKIYKAADSQLQIEGLYNEIANILLKDIEITYLGQEVNSQTLTPTNFSSYFKGSELVCSGLLTPEFEDEMNIQIKMTSVQGKETIQLKHDLVNLPNTTMSNSPSLTKLGSLSEITRNTWVYLTLKKLFKEERTDINTEKIISLALKYGFVTPLTSMVVTQAKLVGRVQSEEETRYNSYPNRQSGLYHHMLNRGSNGPPGKPPVVRTTSPPPRQTTTTHPQTNIKGIINSLPGVFLEPYGCNVTLCLKKPTFCGLLREVHLLIDMYAFIHIYGLPTRQHHFSCLESFDMIIIETKDKFVTKITPDFLTKYNTTISLDNKKDVNLNVDKYLKLKVNIKTLHTRKVLSVQFTVLQPLPNPKGILGMYMSNMTCEKSESNHLMIGIGSNLYSSADSDLVPCSMDST